jgi:tetratricopeptide (TPR) repeat protein
MFLLIPIVMIGWIPVILLIFSALPPRRAVILAFVLAWLFLPCAGYSLPGVPDYTKRSATSLGVILGTALFRSDLLFALRPRWFDVPMAAWCLCPIASSLSNGLGLYDGLSVSFEFFVTWGLSYLIGRVYFTRIEHLREMAIGIVEGGLIYVPLCLWELRMSPQIHRIVYGFDPSGWGEVVHGGYRPKAFMFSALELGVWMTATSTTGFWLWASGAIDEHWRFPFKWLLIPLVITTVLCKVAGAWFLLILGVALWYLLKWSGSRLPLLVLVLVPTLYLATRATGIWSGNQAVELIRSVLGERRADSFGTRVFNENQLSAKALQMPVFGWGGWSRARVMNDEGKDVCITDGLWVIALGNHGLVGLTSFYSALLLPMILLYNRLPARALLTPTVAPTCVLAILLNLYAIDCLANGMVNPIYTLVLGGLTGVLGTLDQIESSYQNAQNRAGLSEVLEEFRRSKHQRMDRGGTFHESGPDPREEAAIRLGLLGRSLMEHGMTQEAEEAWHSALQHWAGLAADYPDDPEYRTCWLDGLNDTAWSLLTLPGLEPGNVSRAIQLAEQTVGLEPDGATYWNTLGIAYHRAGDWKAAIHALERSMELSAGGTSFDYYFLAMACWNHGDREQARLWYSRANSWMDAHSPEHADLLRFRAEARSLVESSRV